MSTIMAVSSGSIGAAKLWGEGGQGASEAGMVKDANRYQSRTSHEMILVYEF